MRKLAVAAVVAALAQAAPAGGEPQGTPAPKPAPVCLLTYMIETTKIVDPQTILFYMRDRKIWKNTLPYRCPGLAFNGFVYVTSVDEICGNMQRIRVLQSGEICELGPFTPYTPPAAPSPAHH